MVRTFFTRARARLTRDLCPTPTVNATSQYRYLLRLVPSSSISVSRLNDLACPELVALVRHALFIASCKTSSPWESKGSRLLRRVPLKSTGSWGIIAILDLRVFNPIFEMSTPSIVILPEDSLTIRWDFSALTYSARRNKATVMDVLPAPVLPTMPIFSPPLLSKDLGEFSLVSPDDLRLLTFL